MRLRALRNDTRLNRVRLCIRHSIAFADSLARENPLSRFRKPEGGKGK